MLCLRSSIAQESGKHCFGHLIADHGSLLKIDVCPVSIARRSCDHLYYETAEHKSGDAQHRAHHISPSLQKHDRDQTGNEQGGQQDGKCGHSEPLRLGAPGERILSV